jgi:hypothetical protein
MIVVYFNVRGLGGSIKKRKVRDLVFKNQIDFLAIQETKLETVSDSLCYSLWGSQDCCWAYLPSIGSSGGILSVWRKSMSSLLFSFIGEGYVGVCLEWGVERHICFVVNVYAKCDLVAKRSLWEALRSSKLRFGSGLWCILGDFNSVVCGEERRGVNNESTLTTDMREFGGFIEGMGLVDLPLLGRRYTWFHPSGRAISRIDRVLVSPEWLQCWGQSSLWILPRDVSDHCPLLLK